MKNEDYIILVLVCVALRLCSAVPLLSEKTPDGQIFQQFSSKTAVDLGVDVSDDDVPWNLRQALVNATLSDDVSLNQYSDSNDVTKVWTRLNFPELRIPASSEKMVQIKDVNRLVTLSLTPRSFFKGHMRLLKAIAKLYSHVTNETLNPRENVIATIGATEALTIAFQSLTEPGDEWIIIEPFWSKYKPQIELAHGILRYSNLKLYNTSGHIEGNDWKFDRKEFASLFNHKTRGIILNNPNNPTGKLYTRSELQFIADLAEKWNVIVISDEAHEWAVYEPQKIVKFGTLPGMFNRTLTVGSASKTFNVAGWRIGWVYGPAHLISRLSYVHDFFVQSAPTPQQIAVAYAFEQEYKNYGKPYCHFMTNMRSAKRNRDFLVQAFRNAGMIPTVPAGGYCMVATWPQLTNNPSRVNGEIGSDMSEKFSNWMTKNIGVLGFPMSHYYGDEHRRLGDKYIRFCYQKKNETLQIAANNLLRLRYFETTM